MRWYLMHEGKTAGPVTGEDIVAEGRQGRLVLGMHVRDEAGAWMPIEHSPFAQYVARPEPLVVPKQSLPGWVTPLASAAVVSVLLLGWWALKPARYQETPVPDVPASPKAAAAMVPEKPVEPSPVEMMELAASLPAAISVAKPLMQDTSPGDESNQGAAMLAVWASKHMTWKILQEIPETKYSQVMKDSEGERGKRLCFSGFLIEIYAARPGGQLVSHGGLSSYGGDIVRFVALGSSGSLVARSNARICGVVTGRESYNNSGGGMTHAVAVVGMFDLPENK